MSAGDLNTLGERRAPIRSLFLIALVLAAGTYVPELGLSSLLQPILSSNIIAGGSLFQLYNLIESAVFFAFNPVFCFLVFYRIGLKLKTWTISDPLGLLKHTFGGGLLGYGIAYLAFIAFETSINGPNFVGPNTNWFLWSAQLILGLSRSGIDIAFIAFAGVMVGRLRSVAPMEDTGEHVPPAPATA